METDQHISRLLRLKRHEQPPPGYHETFLREFYRRQRMAAMRQPWHVAAWGRVTNFFANLSNVEVPALAYASVAAVALAVSVAVVTINPGSDGSTVASTNIFDTPNYSVAPTNLNFPQKIKPVSLTNVPEHDILDTKPVRNDRPFDF